MDVENRADPGRTHAGLYVRAMAKWLAVAMVTGVFCGVVGSLFHIGVERATELREQHPWLLWCLPAAGLVIVAFYKLTKTEGQGTNDIIEAVHHGKKLSIWLLPAIFLGTVLTHLCGGSAGREGAALQMGGTIGRHTGGLFRLDDRDLRTATMAGMAAFFSALFGTPLTATVFAIVVISIGVVYHVAFIPCLTASLVSYWISLAMGVAPTRFAVAAPELEKLMLLRVAVLAVGCALVSVLLCRTLHFAEHQMKKRLPNAWLRVAAGGCAVIALTYLCGTRDYNGAGMDIITAAVEQGSARPEAFLLKILCGRGGPDGGVLRSHQLPAGVHLPVCGAVRRRRPAVLRPGLRHQLHAVGLQRPVLQPDHRLLQAEGPVYQCPHQRPPRRGAGGPLSPGGISGGRGLICGGA